MFLSGQSLCGMLARPFAVEHASRNFVIPGSTTAIAIARLPFRNKSKEAVHSDRAQHAKKTKQKVEENQATAQARELRELRLNAT